ncbi:hypothetical protein D9Q98_005645 [Chlorella vulgaris]|uniref:Uncharacterized protein n=1 Tax=Chlorella vulgaris TaxID=3077 RepID=A0A9D4TMM1_CHLVU|nr:hypothetical protein D9Q98_005645 [Chlorella vulgaris]
MIASRAGASYGSKHALEQQKSKRDSTPAPDRLLTDRTSYISYLEAQLERVSAACLSVQAYDSRIEESVAAVRCLEGKLLSLSRLVSTTQQCAERQECAQREAAAEAARRLSALESRLQELEQPHRVAEWEAKLRAVSARLDSQLVQMESTAEQRIKDAAAEACHESHLQLERRIGDAAGRLSEVERRVRAVDEHSHKVDQGAAVVDLAARLGSLEDSVTHLATSDGGIRTTLGSLQAAVGQLKTAVVALELRPPLADAAASGADCLQWLDRARQALKREVSEIKQEHSALVVGLHSAATAAAAAPQSPRKALAGRVLLDLQGSMQQEVGRELQALQQADQLLANVASTLTKPAASGQQGGSKTCSAAGGDARSDGCWTIAAGPPAAAAKQASNAAQAPADSYPAAPSSQQAVACAADGVLAQLQQLVGAAGSAGASSGGEGSLRGTFSQMQAMLQSVCQLLQEPEQFLQPLQQPQPLPGPREGYQAAAARYLGRNAAARRSVEGSHVAAAAPSSSGRPAWAPAGSSSRAAGAAASAVVRLPSHRSSTAAAAAAGGAAREAMRESVLGQRALEERRRRLQELYAELRQD